MKETVYIDRDNTIDLILKSDDQAVDLSGVTKMELVFSDGPETVSSEDNPEIFDWSLGEGKVILSLGHLDFLTVGQWYRPKLHVYDVDNSNGIFWGIIRFRVKG